MHWTRKRRERATNSMNLQSTYSSLSPSWYSNGCSWVGCFFHGLLSPAPFPGGQTLGVIVFSLPGNCSYTVRRLLGTPEDGTGFSLSLSVYIFVGTRKYMCPHAHAHHLVDSCSFSLHREWFLLPLFSLVRMLGLGFAKFCWVHFIIWISRTMSTLGSCSCSPNSRIWVDTWWQSLGNSIPLPSRRHQTLWFVSRAHFYSLFFLHICFFHSRLVPACIVHVALCLRCGGCVLHLLHRWPSWCCSLWRDYCSTGGAIYSKENGPVRASRRPHDMGRLPYQACVQ